jgi:hypothetical protein
MGIKEKIKIKSRNGKTKEYVTIISVMERRRRDFGLGFKSIWAFLDF